MDAAGGAQMSEKVRLVVRLLESYGWELDSIIKNERMNTRVFRKTTGVPDEPYIIHLDDDNAVDEETMERVRDFLERAATED